jgi:heat shock protein HtpX
MGLASALAKLERYQQGFLERIIIPGRHVPEPSLLRTHPTTEERIRRLRALAADLTPAPSRPIPSTGYPFLTRTPQVVRVPRWRVGGLWF